ncbi:GntR family transcriptional regulator [Amycolatopsis antarctica]|uniref:GntR family transcriptional regulator n=1 Tax=Amycolatopsis antarctica TaxID=1854586 RepID=UPI0013FDF2F4|nr:GntR family transcriptional regulator [Amycolatopsis antarctica]
MHAYERIAQDLEAEIENGTWSPGDMLPTLPELEQRFGASRITVRGALEQLTQRGFVYTGYKGRRGTIVRRRGRTTILATLPLRPDRNPCGHDAFTEVADSLHLQPTKKFELRREAPSADVSSRLGISPDSLVVVRETRQMLDDEPWSIETSYYPVELAKEVGLDTPHDIPEGTIRALAAAGHPEISWVDEVADGTADADEAHRLSIPVGSSLLIQTRTASTAQRVTRVTRYLRLGQRNVLMWEIGDESGVEMIRRTRTGVNRS